MLVYQFFQYKFALIFFYMPNLLAEMGTRYFYSTDDNGTNTFPKKYRQYDFRYFVKKVSAVTVFGTF